MEYNATQMKMKKTHSDAANGVLVAESNNASPLFIHFQFILWKHFKGLAIHSFPVSQFRRLLKQSYLE